VENQQPVRGRPARLPDPPYHLVVFTSLRSSDDTEDGYTLTAERMEQLVGGRPGYPGPS
jgi:hypothetical protein